jgi:Leucine-rich repeat (LRR) protein
LSGNYFIGNPLSRDPSSLVHLDLSESLSNYEQLANLTSCSALDGLEYLGLMSCNINSHGLRTVALSYNLRNLKILILRDNLISDVKHVSSEETDMKKVMKLEVLDVSKNKIRKGKKVDPMFANTVVFLW